MPELFTSIPNLLIGLTMGTYWYRVIRMARKQKLRTGRAANLVPAEATGRVIRVIWTPVIVAWVLLPIVGGLWADPVAVFRPMMDVAWGRWIGAAVVVFGFVLTRACWRRMGTAWRMGIDPSERNPLVVTGPFAWVRHPIYGLSAGMMVATAASLPSPAMIGVAAVHIFLLLWESAREERHLLRVHGEVYAAYRRAVGRLAPKRFRPYRNREL